MIFTETALKGVFLIDPEPVQDERGMFMRTWRNRNSKLMDFGLHGYSQAFQ